ncbi:MAG TPA: NfeD family protein, partial [Nitrolancea sp.]|nr:NfeD family protein [Nitrolancea sp.]
DNAWWAIGVLLAAEMATLASAHWVRHALLTAVGVAGFAIGSFLLLAIASIPALVVLASVAVVAVASFALAAAARRAHDWPVQTGREVLIGRLAETREQLDPQGFVLINGELWRATSVAGPIPRGATVRVLAIEGLTLLVTLDGRGQVEDLRDADRREAATTRLERFGG